MQLNEILPKHLAAAIQISESQLWIVAENSELLFKPRRMQSVGKKHRPIDPMFREPKRIYRKLHRWLLKQSLSHPAAHGGVAGRSCFSSASVHLGKKFYWSRDASECFPSISVSAFDNEMLQLGFCDETAAILTMLCTIRGAIPQGSPLSNDALNLYFWRIDQHLASYSGQNKLDYSRVADDFQLSGNCENAGSIGAQLIENLLRQRDIKINLKKKNENGFRRQNEKPLVHGIAVHNSRGTQISDAHRKTSVDNAIRYLASARSVHYETLEAIAEKRRVLVGYLYYCREAQFSPAKLVRQHLDAGDKRIRNKLLSMKLSAYKGKWWLVSNKRNEPHRLAAQWREYERINNH